MAVRLWEVMERAQSGPFMEENYYVKKCLMPTVKKLVRKYEIKYNPANPVPADNDMADRIWQAGKELFLTVGVYNQDTHRVIKFEEREVNEALFAAPSYYMVGANHDLRYFGHRKVEDTKKPFIIMSPDITYDEEIFFSACLSYFKEPLLDGICSPLLGDFMGRPMTSHFPLEIGGSMHHAMTLRETARLAGRPDTFFVAVGTAESDMAQIAVSNDQWGVRANDARLCGGITELMTNNQMLNKAVHYNQMGNLCAILPGAIYGGYAGGAEGTAVMQIAFILQGLCVYGASFSQNFPFHLLYGSNTGREMLWIISAYSQAASRNSHLVMDSNCFANAGPMTDMLFYEGAAHAIASVVSGNNLWTCAPCRNKIHNHGTPLEARFAAEVAHSVVAQGMTREQASEVCNKLLAKYEEKIPIDNYGVPYQEAYDVLKCVPKPAYLDLFYQCKEEVAKLGVNFLY
ncbi:MAG: monomethylamine:corrinoid methyltransferase [Clostridiales bacterium]